MLSFLVVVLHSEIWIKDWNWLYKIELMKDLKNILKMENKVLLKSKLQIQWHKNMLYGLVVPVSLQMKDLNQWCIQDKNIWKKVLLAVDLTLFLVSKKIYNLVF